MATEFDDKLHAKHKRSNTSTTPTIPTGGPACLIGGPCIGMPGGGTPWGGGIPTPRGSIWLLGGMSNPKLVHKNSHNKIRVGKLYKAKSKLCSLRPNKI